METSGRKYKNPRPLSNALSLLLKNLGIETKIKQYEALNIWSKIVGEKVAAATTVEKVREGILYVRVKNSAWRNELVYMKQEILTKIDKAVGSNVIRDIWFI